MLKLNRTHRVHRTLQRKQRGFWGVGGSGHRKLAKPVGKVLVTVWPKGIACNNSLLHSKDLWAQKHRCQRLSHASPRPPRHFACQRLLSFRLTGGLLATGERKKLCNEVVQWEGQ